MSAECKVCKHYAMGVSANGICRACLRVEMESVEPLDKRRLRIVKYNGVTYLDSLTGATVCVAGGCVSCNEKHKHGALLIEYDDGEYLPTFCAPCVLHMVELLIKGESK